MCTNTCVPLAALSHAATLPPPAIWLRPGRPLIPLSCMQMVIRELRKTEATQVIIFYLVLSTLGYSLLGCAFTWRQLITPRSARDCGLLLGLGLCGYGNQLCTTKGLAKAKAASVMSMQYCSLVFTQLAGVVLFAEYPSLPQAAGMVVIVVSMVGYLWYEGRAKNK